MTPTELNDALIDHSVEIFNAIKDPSNTLRYDQARALGDFGTAMSQAWLGEFDWQENTNSDLCGALGHCTLDYVAENFDTWITSL